MEDFIQAGPFIGKISFKSLKEAYQKLLQGNGPTRAVAEQALQLFEKNPSLEKGYFKKSVFEKNLKDVNELMSCLFPPALTENEIKLAVFPYSNEIFYDTERFRNIRKNAVNNVDDEIFSLFVEEKHSFNLLPYAIILNKYYKFQGDFSRPLHLKVEQQDGLQKTFRVTFNADFIDIYPNENAIEITEAISDELLADPYNPEIWATYFPKGSWTIEGFGILNLFDVSKDEQIDVFKTHLIQPNSQESLDQIIQDIRDIFGFKDLLVGNYQVQNNTILPSYDENIISLSVRSSEALECKDYACDFIQEHLFDHHEPVVLSDVEKYHLGSKGNHLSNTLMSKGIKSVILLPMAINDDLSFIIEIASKVKNQLNAINLLKLDNILPFIRSYVKRIYDEFENQISAVIQRECTSIHPSVEWRFKEEAMQYLLKVKHGRQASFHEVTFENILPLYGQIDIKGSSDARNNAIQKDLLQQLTLSRAILQELISQKEYPYYEQLIFEINERVDEIEHHFQANTEQTVQGFFQKELFPVFTHLSKGQPTLKSLQVFFKEFDEETHSIYQARRVYDETVDAINSELSDFIEAKQVLAQEMFPHYFEKYKTDGIEHNIYVGQSIAQQKDYHVSALYNLRLWQLQVMCEMEAMFYENQSRFPIQLKVASMIFVYDIPITIRYRIDEKQFDVDGAYNVRYEMIKKRIDKAYIRNSQTRLAQPRKLAIVYSNPSIEYEYLKYLRFLQSKSYIGENIEVVEVEELQGASGLKAIVADINLNLNKTDTLFTIKDLEVVE